MWQACQCKDLSWPWVSRKLDVLVWTRERGAGEMTRGGIDFL